MRVCVLGYVGCTGTEAANECSVALLMSQSDRPESMEIVETANIVHQISSAALCGRPEETAVQSQHSYKLE